MGNKTDPCKKEMLAKSLAQCGCVQEILDAAYAAMGNPALAHDMNYRLIAYSRGVVTDDPIWNEFISTGTVSPDVLNFYKEEDFFAMAANAEKLTFLVSDKLKYDRIFGKLLDSNNFQVGCACAVESDKPFEDGDPELFEAVCDSLSMEVGKNAFFQDYGQEYMEELVRELIAGRIVDRRLYTAHVQSIYALLKANLYLAVADISKCGPLPAADAALGAEAGFGAEVSAAVGTAAGSGAGTGAAACTEVGTAAGSGMGGSAGARFGGAGTGAGTGAAARLDSLSARLAYFKDLFRQAQPAFKYAVHSNYIVAIISTDYAEFSVQRDLKALNRLFAEHNIYAGVSGCFENLFDLGKYYCEALDALRGGLGDKAACDGNSGGGGVHGSGATSGACNSNCDAGGAVESRNGYGENGGGNSSGDADGDGYGYVGNDVGERVFKYGGAK